MIVGTPSELVVPSAGFVSVTAVTVMARWATVNDSSTLGAAAQVALPACDARIVHVPAATIVDVAARDGADGRRLRGQSHRQPARRRGGDRDGRIAVRRG